MEKSLSFPSCPISVGKDPVRELVSRNKNSNSFRRPSWEGRLPVSSSLLHTPKIWRSVRRNSSGGNSPCNLQQKKEVRNRSIDSRANAETKHPQLTHCCKPRDDGRPRCRRNNSASEPPGSSRGRGYEYVHRNWRCLGLS